MEGKNIMILLNSEKLSLIKKAQNNIIGTGLVVLGVIGLAMPILPGFLLIFLGIRYTKG